MKQTAIALAGMTLLLVSGCAHYEYDLVSPPELAQHIGAKGDQVIHRDPLEYRLRAVEDRLVMNIDNPTNDPITLLGDRSYVVAPGGQSHPVRGQTIAPHTFMRMILPPMHPFYQETGPGFGIGIGIGSAWGYRGYRRYDPFFYDYAYPRYLSYYDPSDATYWSWEGETDVRLHLMFQRGNGTFAHEFSFHRKKM